MKNESTNDASTGGTAIYTAIFGGYDRLREVPADVYQQAQAAGVRFGCYTDDVNLKSSTWEILVSPFRFGSRLAAKRPKIKSHRYLPDFERSIWIDGSMEISGPLWEWFDRFDVGVPLALFQHTCRRCLFAEIQACREKRKDAESELQRAEMAYRIAGHPPNAGLFMGGILLRRHGQRINELNEAWWTEVCTRSIRDQISLPYVLRLTGIPFHSFPVDGWREFLRLHPHSRTATKVAQ